MYHVTFFLTKGDHREKGYRPEKTSITDTIRIKCTCEYTQRGEGRQIGIVSYLVTHGSHALLFWELQFVRQK